MVAIRGIADIEKTALNTRASSQRSRPSNNFPIGRRPPYRVAV